MTDAHGNGTESAGELMDEIISGIPELPESVASVAQLLADVVGDAEIEWEGSGEPYVVATSCLYVADRIIRQDESYTQGELCRLAPGTQPTVRRHYHDIPQSFVEHATEEQFSTLTAIEVEVYPDGGWPTTVSALAMLRIFANAERSGISLVDIDPWIDPQPVHDLASSIEAIQP